MTSAGAVWAFTSADRFEITGRGTVFAVRYTGHADALIGRVVCIDGENWLVRGVETARVLTDPPKVLEGIGLVVRKVDEPTMAQIAEFQRRYREFCDLRVMFAAYRDAEEKRLHELEHANIWPLWRKLRADVEEIGLPLDVMNGG